MNRALPKKCFISHSYRDIEDTHLLLEMLPPKITPYLFPEITVTPDEMVSNNLIQAILACDGVIYINGGLWAASFRVAFERDFDKRAKLPVFEFQPATKEIKFDQTPPLHLPVFPSYSKQDRMRVDQILRVMRSERYFDIFIPQEMPAGSAWADETSNAIDSRLRDGGYVVAFLSVAAVSSAFVKREINSALSENSDRLILAWIDHPQVMPSDFPVPQTQWLVLNRLDDPHSLNWNEIDRLIVILYWRIYRNTRTNGLH